MKKNKKLTKLIIPIIISFCLFVLFSTTVWAEDPVKNYELLAPLPGMNEKGAAPSLGDYLTNMFYIGIGVAGVLAVIMITIGGLQYMTTEAISGKSGAKTRINNAIFGLILALASFMLLREINTDFVNPSLEIEPVEKPTPIQPPTTNTSYKGTCWDSSGEPAVCSGKDFSTCQASCVAQCGTVQYVSKCRKDALSGGKFGARCLIGGVEKNCGVGTDDQKTCEQQCESGCDKTNVSYITPCKETIADPDYQ